MLKILKNRYLIAIAILSTALIIAFSNIVFFGKTLTTSSLTVGTTRNGPYLYKANKPLLPITDGGASAWHFEPAMQLNNQAYKEGRLPLWNPYNGGGQPLAADMQSSSFYPLALPLFVNPSPAVWDFFLLLRLLVAGLLAFAYLKLIKINTTASLAGAITFMLSGYFVFFIHMAHLNVEILIPLMLIAIELLFKRLNLFSVSVITISSALVILGGMPEAAFINLAFASCYFIYRLFYEYKLEKNPKIILKIIAYFSLGIFVGLIISFISWAPFIEYSKIFWSNHNNTNKGMLSLNKKFIVQYLSPLFLGLVNVVYVGIIPLFLSIVTKKEHKFKWFFSIAALIVFLKTFGIGLNWLGNLPVLSQVFFFKYGQILFAMSISVLTAMAIDSGFKIKLSRIFVIVPIWIYVLYYSLTNVEKLFNVKRLRLDYYSATAIKWALVFLAVGITITILPKVFKKIKINHLAIATTLLIFLELWSHIPSTRAKRHNPYIAPPFIKYLQSKNGLFRTYAANAILWPNTNAPYKIQDIRSLNAIQPSNYMNYLSLFLDLRKRGHITGLEGINFDSKFFDALNVKYVLALKPLEKNLDYWLDRNKIPKTSIDGEIWYKTPFESDFTFPKDVKYLNFSSNARTTQKLKIETLSKSTPIVLFNKKIVAGKKTYKINIANFSGQSIRLKFSSTIFLNSLYFSNNNKLKNKFKPIFKDNKVTPPVTIYQNKQVIPRITVVDKTTYATTNLADKLSKIDIKKRALVETPVKLNNKKKLKYSIKVVDYKPQKIKIKVKTNKKSLLVLADTYYPGWKVYVNGKEKNIYKTNIMFRGVKIGPSAREIVFNYKSAVYKNGFLGLIVGFLTIFTFAFIEIGKTKE